MKVKREAFLNQLKSVSPGLANREGAEQSTCFVFRAGEVMTFDNWVFAHRTIDVDLVGAVHAKTMMNNLEKLPNDIVDVKMKKDGSAVIVSGGENRKCQLKVAPDKFPLAVEDPGNWRTIPPELMEAIGLVQGCAGDDEEFAVLTYVHIHPDYVEATDRIRIARYPLATGAEESVLARASAVRRITGFALTEMTEDDKWVYFRNSEGLRFAIRRNTDEFIKVGDFLSHDDMKSVTLPVGIEEIVNRAADFCSVADELINVSISDGEIVVVGIGAYGKYFEKKEVGYKGDPIEFSVRPKLLTELSKKSNDCWVAHNRLLVDTGKFTFVSAISTGEKKNGSSDAE